MKIQVEYSVMSIEKEVPDGPYSERLVEDLKKLKLGVLDELPTALFEPSKKAMVINLYENDGSFIDTIFFT